jgi:hypothetical protein
MLNHSQEQIHVVGNTVDPDLLERVRQLLSSGSAIVGVNGDFGKERVVEG